MGSNQLNNFSQNGSSKDNVYTGGGTNNITGTQNISGLQTITGGSIGASEQSTASIAGTLTRLDSGKTFFWNHADGGSYELPALEANLRFDFEVAVVPTNGNNVVKTPLLADTINGGGVINGAAVIADAEDQVNFVASTCKIGDKLTIKCDGVQYLATAMSLAAGGITFTKT